MNNIIRVSNLEMYPEKVKRAVLSGNTQIITEGKVIIDIDGNGTNLAIAIPDNTLLPYTNSVLVDVSKEANPDGIIYVYQQGTNNLLQIPIEYTEGEARYKITFNVSSAKGRVGVQVYNLDTRDLHQYRLNINLETLAYLSSVYQDKLADYIIVESITNPDTKNPIEVRIEEFCRLFSKLFHKYSVALDVRKEDLLGLHAVLTHSKPEILADDSLSGLGFSYVLREAGDILLDAIVLSMD